MQALCTVVRCAAPFPSPVLLLALMRGTHPQGIPQANAHRMHKRFKLAKQASAECRRKSYISPARSNQESQFVLRGPSCQSRNYSVRLWSLILPAASLWHKALLSFDWAIILAGWVKDNKRTTTCKSHDLHFFVLVSCILLQGS